MERQNITARRDSLPGGRSRYPDLLKTDESKILLENLPEKFIGFIEVPMGIAGPIDYRVNDTNQTSVIPLATTERALIASVSRGVKALSLAGETDVIVKNEGMTRAPAFECCTQRKANEVKKWIENNSEKIGEIAKTTSGHIQYISTFSRVDGCDLFARMSFTTGDAMGMNMVTIAADAIADYICQVFPDITLGTISSNFCADKKPSYVNVLLGRGYQVQAEAMIARSLIAEVLKTTAKKIERVYVKKILKGSNLAGSLAQNAHVANVLSAMYLATGQDTAHVVEGSNATLSCEERAGDLYIALNLPNILVGTVGGGTSLPTQKQARYLIGNGAEVTPTILAGAIGVAALAGELSLIASLSQNTLASSHKRLRGS